MDAIAGARPDVAANIEPEAVEESRIAGRKDLATRERAAIRAHREAPDMAGGGLLLWGGRAGGGGGGFICWGGRAPWVLPNRTRPPGGRPALVGAGVQ